LLKREAGLTLPSWEDLIRRPSLDPVDIERVPEAITHMLREAETGEADRLFKKVLAYLSNGAPEQKIATIKVIPAMVAALSKNVRWVNIEASLSLLLANYYRKETDPDVLSALLSSLLFSFRENFESGNLAACQSLLSTIRSRANSFEIFEDVVSQHINILTTPFNYSIREGTEAADTALDYLKLCGNAGVQFFLKLLAEEEDKHVRSRLISLIEKLDRVDLLPEIEKGLSDSRWYVVRNMVTIIGKMMDLKETPAFLQQAAKHPDPRVAKELIKKLLKTITPTDAPIVIQLLMHPDKVIRNQAIHLTAKLNPQTAIPILLSLVSTEKKEDTDLRAFAYQNLLRMKATGAVPMAMILLDTFAGKADVIERSYAVKVLGELGRAEGRSVLQKVASSDPSPEVRSLATSYL
jgi:HEAT repeats